MGGNFPGGIHQEGSLTGGNFPVGSFPNAKEKTCEEFSNTHALTLIFIRKIFILHTGSLRV